MRACAVLLILSAAAASKGQTPVVMASETLQKCLGIVPGADKMNRGPSTEQFCKQLPGASFYDQAGAVFKAGDHARAAQIVAKAAEAGNAVAMLRLALLYDQGDGVKQSSKMAFVWYEKASALGEPESQNQMGTYYEVALGGVENWDLAAKLWQASAQQGWTKGQFSYARAFQFGIGVPQNRQMAIAWYRKAAAQGNAKADYWAKWLRDPTNNIGFRDDIEHDIVIGGTLRFGGSLIGGDPAGITFHNSVQRAHWIMGLRNRVDKEEADTWRQIRKREYDDCKREGRDNCMAPR